MKNVRTSGFIISINMIFNGTNLNCTGSIDPNRRNLDTKIAGPLIWVILKQTRHSSVKRRVIFINTHSISDEVPKFQNKSHIFQKNELSAGNLWKMILTLFFHDLSLNTCRKHFERVSKAKDLTEWQLCLLCSCFLQQRNQSFRSTASSALNKIKLDLI